MKTGTILSVTGMFLAGSIYQAMRKVLFQISGTGLHGQVHYFHKPWFVSLQGAVGCMLCFIPFWITIWNHKRNTKKVSDGMEPLLELPDASEHSGDLVLARHEQEAGQDVPYHPSMRPDEFKKGSYSPGFEWGRITKVLKVAVPAVLGQLSVALQGAGLVYTSASTNQMISGSVVIFSALLSKAFLNRQLNRLHCIGISLVCLSVVAVAFSHMEDQKYQKHGARQLGGEPDITPAQAGAGIVLVLISQLVSAIQMILEELMLNDVRLHPYELLGWEGVFGTLFMLCISLPLAMVIPGSDVEGCLENTKDTVVMLGQNRPIAAINAVVFTSALLVNVASVFVTSVLGSVFRAVLSVSRTAFIWAFDIALYYSRWGDGTLGEAWDSHSSPIQLVGFLLGLAGTVVYAQGTTRVARACQEIKEGKAAPESEAYHSILRRVFFPAHPYLPAMRTIRSFGNLLHAHRYVKGNSFWQTLSARTSWILHPHEVDPTRISANRFHDPFAPGLPYKCLLNGAVEVYDEEGGDYCIPATVPGSPGPAESR